MQIEITEIEPCKLSINYQADALEILNKRGEILNAFKNAPVPGFRKGKASLDAIKVHYRTQIDESLKRALAEDAYHNTLFEKKLRPHGAPMFESLMLADGKFICEFKLHTKPDFELGPYMGLEIPKPHSAMGEVELAERMMQELRVRLGEASPYTEDDFVQTGDNLIIDMEGSIDGEKIEGLCAQGEMLKVGTSPVAAFDDNMLGMKLGETREFTVLAPPGGLPSISGRLISFKVSLVMGSKTTPAPLDDTLATRFGKKDFAELKEFVRATAGARAANLEKDALVQALAKKLIESNDVKVPDWMTLSEAQYIAHSSNLKWEEISDLDKEKYLEVSQNNVKISLILDKVREVEPEAQLTDQETFEVVKRHLAQTETPETIDKKIMEMNKSGYLQVLFSRIRDEHALDFILKSVKIVE